jgi:hypothetical protein
MAKRRRRRSFSRTPVAVTGVFVLLVIVVTIVLVMNRGTAPRAGTTSATVTELSSTTQLTLAPDDIIHPNKNAPPTAWWGDSLTAGRVTDWLALFLDWPVVYKGGVGGENSTQIAARQGGIACPLTVSGNSIPASGPVVVTVPFANLPSYQGPQSFYGTLAGVPGTLSRSGPAGPDDGTTIRTFVRSTPGAITACPPDTPFIFDLAVTHRADMLIVWSGGNGAADGHAIPADIASMIAYAKEAGVDRYLVLSVINGAGEGIGTGSYKAITAGNKALADTYGDRFVDVRRQLIDNGLALVGITPTAQDLADVAADTVPASLRGDSIHLTDAGQGVVAHFVFARMVAKGWASPTQNSLRGW